GRVVASGKALPASELRARYQRELMAALARPPSRGGHANALQHLLGHLRGRADAADRAALLAAIDDYRQGFVPLAVPLTWLRHEVQRSGTAYAARQTYLDPP